VQDGGLHRILPGFVDVLETGLVAEAAYAAASNSPTSAMSAARSPGRRPVMAPCTEFSASRNAPFRSRWLF